MSGLSVSPPPRAPLNPPRPQVSRDVEQFPDSRYSAADCERHPQGVAVGEKICLSAVRGRS
jgi:hypothetical protein